jgi:signal transduction histidine kinase/Flp pilus assembly protein TadD
MRKNNLTPAIIFLFIFQAICLPQNRFDSLYNGIRTYPDSTKVRILNEFCWSNRNKTPQIALRAGELALKIAERLEDRKLQSRSLNLIGVVYRNLGDYNKSIALYKKALHLAEEIKDSNQIAYSYNNIGGLYRLEGNYKSALEYILDALSVFEKIGDKKGMAFCTINIGLIYRREQNYLKSLEYLNLTLKLREEIKDRSGRALALELIAQIYLDQGKILEATEYFTEVEKEYTLLDDKKGLASIWAGMGEVYSREKNFQKAIEYHKSALNISYNIKFIEGEILNHNNLGLIYAQIGDYRNADLNFEAALKIASGSKEIIPQLECYKSFAKYNEIRKDYKAALFYLKKYHSLKDSLNNQENISFINELETSYKSDKAEKENIILMNDIAAEKRQTNYLIIISFLIVVLALIIYNRYRLNKATNQKLRELNALKDKFFGIIAHDLRNPFSAIFNFSDLLLRNFDGLKDEEKKDMINSIDQAGRKTYKLLENLLEWSLLQTGGIEFAPVQINLNEIVLETFFAVEPMAEAKNITLKTDIDANITVAGDEEMIKTVFRNLISNGIKFTGQSGRVWVSAEAEGKFYKISVSDTGKGIGKEMQEKLFRIDSVYTTEGTGGEHGTGLGLILCKEFVEKNGGKIRVESESGKGSRFIFTLPSSL